jgi:hypothetical protein
MVSVLVLLTILVCFATDCCGIRSHGLNVVR